MTAPEKVTPLPCADCGRLSGRIHLTSTLAAEGSFGGVGGRNYCHTINAPHHKENRMREITMNLCRAHQADVMNTAMSITDCPCCIALSALAAPAPVQGDEPLRQAIRDALNNLGVPGPGYPAPVAEAVRILTLALCNGLCPPCDMGENTECLCPPPPLAALAPPAEDGEKGKGRA